MTMVLNCRLLAAIIVAPLWLLLSCILSCGTETDIYCLKTLKESLQDPYNYLKSSWNFENNTEGFICKFTGIDCWHPDENRVLNIRLSDMGLKGPFPRSIQNCTSLTGLDLSGNELFGSIPPDIYDILPFVTALDLSSNNLSGEIPVSLSNCTYLNILKLDHNRLTGQIPPQFGLLSRIKQFSVANNLLTGPVATLANSSILADSFANNPGLCGKPLDPCQPAPKKSRTVLIEAAAVGGATFSALGVSIVIICLLCRVSVKKKEDDPEGNKCAHQASPIPTP